MYKKIVVLIISILLICACSKDKSDAIKFKEEFENKNDKYSLVNINENNPFIYKTQGEIDKLINDKETFVVLYGKSDNNETRDLIESIIDSASINGLGRIYYVSRNEDIPLLIGYSKGEIKLSTNELTGLNELISSISIELSTCDVNVGC